MTFSGALVGFLRSAILCGGLLLLPFGSGCATTQVYHLNLDATTAQSTFTALAATAEGMGYQVTRLATAVNIRYDADTWIYYGQRDYDYNMAIVVGSDLDSDQVSTRMAQAKVKGEEIWSRALSTRQHSPIPATQPPAQVQGPTPHS